MDFNAEFDLAIAADVESSGFKLDDWFWNGPAAPATAVQQWRERGPVLTAKFAEWYRGSGYRVWVTPDGRPAVELELEVKFGTVPVKMYIDAVLVGKYGLTVFDWKTSAKKPESWQQLGVYASGIELAYGIRPLYGAYYMARGFGPRGCKPEDLKYVLGPMPLESHELSIAFFSEQFEAMENGIAANAYLARVSKDCNRCPVAYACAALDGIAAPRYDPTHPEFAPF